MVRLVRPALIGLLAVLMHPKRAPAGMPALTLADIPEAVQSLRRLRVSEVARQRLEVLSFFLLGFLICVGVVQIVWNSLRRDFPVLPRLSYSRALGIVVLWGLLFVLVLTMISGARELMTPGAWVKTGFTYRLADQPNPPIEMVIHARVQRLEHVRDRLFQAAKEHGGVFPTPAEFARNFDSTSRVPATGGEVYMYRGGRLQDEEPSGRGPLVLLYEPAAVGSDRLVLFDNGTIRWLSASALERHLKKGSQP
ncbi:hypothetical protein ACYOEI_21825 [Singulisphaera rosea]